MTKKPVQLATICYIDNGKEFLLLHRNKRKRCPPGKWIGVGGKLEPGETPQACAIREIFEETGLTVTKHALKGVITFPDFTPNTDWYTYVFKITGFEGSLIDCNEGDLEWVPYDQVLSKPTWEGDRHFQEWLLEDKPFFPLASAMMGTNCLIIALIFMKNKLIKRKSLGNPGLL